MLKTVVCDDERPALELLVAMLEETGAVEIVAALQSVTEAIAVIDQGGIDLVVLDIDMPGMSGVDAARSLRVDPMPLLVFATAHPEYAVDAFDIDAIDYILKPIEKARVRHAVEKAVRLDRSIRKATGDRAVAAPALEGVERKPDLLQVRDGSRYYVVALGDIVWIEAGGDYSLIHTQTSEIVIRRTLSSLEESLPEDRFLRVHRSFIVGKEHVRQVRRMPKGEAEIHLTGSVTVRSSRSYRDAVTKGIIG